jgi:hypothetical protein
VLSTTAGQASSGTQATVIYRPAAPDQRIAAFACDTRQITARLRISGTAASTGSFRKQTGTTGDENHESHE